MISIELSKVKAAPLKVLLLGAHSDDVEIGVGGTMLSLLAARTDVEVHSVVFSASGERADEARRGAEVFLAGASRAEVEVLDFKGCYFPDQWARIKEAFEDLAGRVEPHVIFTHARHDRHQDHRTLSDLTWNTFRRHLVLEYEIPKYDGELSPPNVYIPLERSDVERKCRLLVEAFASQTHRHWFDEETFRGQLRLRGVECGRSYAEAFVARKMVLG